MKKEFKLSEKKMISSDFNKLPAEIVFLDKDIKEAIQNLKKELKRYFITKQSRTFIDKAFEKHIGVLK